MALLADSYDEITAVYALPEACRKRLRTTNSIEHLNEELRRREQVIRIFPNDDSLIRRMTLLSPWPPAVPLYGGLPGQAGLPGLSSPVVLWYRSI